MAMSRCFALLAALLTAFCIWPSASAQEDGDCNVVSRRAWGAKPARRVDYVVVPLQYAIIQHTATPICRSEDECVERVLSLEANDRVTRRWDDIGASFLVGGDGKVYEGAGWLHVGAHTYGWNKKSVGIMLIGDFSDSLPPRRQLEAVKKLLQCGVDIGVLSEDFKLLAHRQVSATKSPGLALFQEIQNWPWWSERP